MDVPSPRDISPPNYSLWHIPSSTLLVLSAEVQDVACRIRAAIAHGCALKDMMLEVSGEGDLIGMQHVGPDIIAVLPVNVDESPACSDGAGKAAVG